MSRGKLIAAAVATVAGAAYAGIKSSDRAREDLPSMDVIIGAEIQNTEVYLDYLTEEMTEDGEWKENYTEGAIEFDITYSTRHEVEPVKETADEIFGKLKGFDIFEGYEPELVNEGYKLNEKEERTSRVGELQYIFSE